MEKPKSPSYKDAQGLMARFKKAGILPYQEAYLAGEFEDTTAKLYVPTGIVPVDERLGGGFPCGRMTEVFGPEQSFKSGLSLMAIECMLYMGGCSIYYDNEETYDTKKSILFSFRNADGDQPFFYRIRKMQEEFFADLKLMLKIIAEEKEGKSVVLWDSMPATLPRMMLESDEGVRLIGEAARVNAMEFPRCSHLIHQALCAFIVINQVRQNMNMINKYDNPFTTPGGLAPKYYYSLRVFLQKKNKFQWFSDTTTTDGVWVQMKVEKNKNNQPFVDVRFPIIYQDLRGGDPAMAYYEWLVNNKYAVVGGAGRLNCSEIVSDLKVHKTEFHVAYLENLDAFLGFFESKTEFKYAELPLLGVRELTKRMYSSTTPIEKANLR